jgi:hypothetical protein
MARLKSCSENMDALLRDTISANLGCRHVPGEGGGAGEGAGAGVTRRVDGMSALITGRHPISSSVAMKLNAQRMKGSWDVEVIMVV